VTTADDITERQRAVYEYMERYADLNGRPPTFRQVAAEFDVSVNCVTGYMRALEAAGYLAREPGKACGVRLLKTAPPPARIEVTAEELGSMAVYGCRYAMTRGSYAGSEMMAFVRNHMKDVPTNDLKVIARIDCDPTYAAAWRTLLGEISAELGSRAAKGGRP
jgi:SOS-response transcriptional repressor LexA